MLLFTQWSQFLQFGGWFFWIILVIIAGGITYLLEDKDKDETNLGWPSVILIVTMLVLGFTYKTETIALWNSIAWSAFALYVGSWLVFGISWSFFRWWKYVGTWVVKYKAKVAISGASFVRKDDFIPLAANHKARLSAWIIFWPFSIVRYVVGDLFKDVMDKIVTYFSGIYNKISANRFK